MILFSMEHIASLFQVLLFRFYYHHNEEAILITETKYKNSDIWIELKENGVFEEIVFYQQRYKKSHLLEENWKLQIEKDYDELFSSINYSINSFDKIYCSVDINNDILVYASIYNCTLSYIENYKEQFQDDERYSVQTKYGDGDINHEKIAREYDTLSGEKSPFVIERYVWGKKSNKDVVVDFLTEFYSLNQEYHNLLKCCIKEPFFSEQDKTKHNLFLFNSAGWTAPKSGVSVHEVYKVYALIIDTFLKDISNDIIMKDHPINILFYKEADESGLFERKVFKPDIPLELYVFAYGYHFERVISCNSTSNDKIKDYFEENVYLGDTAVFNWYNSIKLLVTYDLELLLGEGYINHYKGVDRSFLLNYRHSIGRDFNNKEPLGINPEILLGKIFVIIDKIESDEINKISKALKNASKETVVVFWNSDNSFSFIPQDFELLKSFVTLTIKKECKPQSNCLNFDDEYIYVYCKDKNIRSKIKSYVKEYELKYSRIKLHVYGDDYNRVKEVYEGRLLEHITEVHDKYEEELKIIKDFVETNKARE